MYLLGPCMKVVICQAADQGWELARPHLDFLADRAEAQHHVQVAPDLHDMPHNCVR